MILLVGGKGSIGRRYAAILRTMEIPYEVYDVEEAEEEKPIMGGKYDGAIIASPTSTHSQYCRVMADQGIRFLCEKPLTRSYAQADDLVKYVKEKGGEGYVVNNYAFALARFEKINMMSYNYYNTGRDGLAHDVCQLIHLSAKHESGLMVDTTSPVWLFVVNGREIPYRDIEISYLAMIEAFLDGVSTALWSVDEGLEMVRDVVMYEAGDWDPRTNGVN